MKNANGLPSPQLKTWPSVDTAKVCPSDPLEEEIFLI